MFHTLIFYFAASVDANTGKNNTADDVKGSALQVNNAADTSGTALSDNVVCF